MGVSSLANVVCCKGRGLCQTGLSFVHESRNEYVCVHVRDQVKQLPCTPYSVSVEEVKTQNNAITVLLTCLSLCVSVKHPYKQYVK
jgi:hypothetical protein